MSTAELVQGTPEWLQARCGRATASRYADIAAKIKSGEAATRKNYKTGIVCERLTGIPVEQFVSKDMERGTCMEPEARAEYEVREGVTVETAGFIEHPSIPMFGCSPDGLIGTDGGLEIKCPKVATHLEWFLARQVPPEHRGQLVASLACTRREWWDFVSYCPELPEHLRYFRYRMIANPQAIELAETEVRQFLAECDQLLAQLETRVTV
jgi:hypothetical protein